MTGDCLLEHLSDVVSALQMGNQMTVQQCNIVDKMSRP